MTNIQEYFVVKNWKKFQQYKDRDPDWIKLHMHLLDDYEFNSMPEADQVHLIKIWLLFAKENPPTSDKIKPLPVDVKFISSRVCAKKKVNIDRLLKTTFLEKYIVKGSECTDSIRTRTPYKEYEPELYKPEKPPLPPFQNWFEEIWGTYPNKIGRKAALRHFKATVKTDTHLQEIRTALENYIKQVEHDRTRKDGFHRQYQNGGTWFNNWHDWVDHKVEIQQKIPVDGIYPEEPKSQEEQALEDEIYGTWNAWENETDSCSNIQKRAQDILSRKDINLSKSQIDALRYILEKVEEGEDFELEEEFVTA